MRSVAVKIAMLAVSVMETGWEDDEEEGESQEKKRYQRTWRGSVGLK